MRCVRALTALLLGAAVASCSKVADTSATGTQPGAEANSWTRPGVLTYAEAQDPALLDPILAASAPTGDLSMLIYSYAVRYDEHAKPVPDLLTEVPTVENGDVSPDGLTLRYKIRPNAKWHDGVAVTSKDLWFTWQCVMNPHNNVVTTDGYKDIASIDYSDPHVAVIHMKRLYAPYLQQIFGVNGNAAVLPEHLLAKYNDDKGSFNRAPYQSAPVGSGPFKFVSWQRGASVRLEAFPDFYLGKPKLTEIVFKILPDEVTMATQVRTHEVDLALHADGSAWPQYQNIPGVIASAPPVYTFDHIDFNLARPLFAHDLLLRRALATAIDRRAIVAKVLHGLGTLTDTDESPLIGQAYDPNTMHDRFDPVKARAMLDADGWKLGPNGIRVKGGVPLHFQISTESESAAFRAMEVLVQEYWHAVGADVEVKNSPTTLMFDNTSIGILQGGHYDTAIFAWYAAADPDDSAIYSADNFPPRGQNNMKWNNPRATAAMNDALKTLDWPRRKRDYFVVQEEFAKDVPSIVIDFRKEPIAMNSDLKGFDPSPVISPFWDPWDYSI